MSKQDQTPNGQAAEPLPQATGSDARTQLKAKMHGACAALEGRTIAANTYPEDSDLHFCWLYGWTEAKLEMRKHPNSAINQNSSAKDKLT